MISKSTLEAVRSAVASVRDPEYPDLNIEQLGILEDVVIDSSTIRIDLVPTILGCPALDTIEQDVLAAARALGYEVTVRFCRSPAWTPERISEDAQQILANEYTIAITPRSGPTECPVCGHTSLEKRSDVGPTACRSVQWCPNCRNPVEVVRSRKATGQ
jgi:ring-1,2-phenylacetyl-CoA epoxidase subunit PaaD